MSNRRSACVPNRRRRSALEAERVFPALVQAHSDPDEGVEASDCSAQTAAPSEEGCVAEGAVRG